MIDAGQDLTVVVCVQSSLTEMGFKVKAATWGVELLSSTDPSRLVELVEQHSPTVTVIEAPFVTVHVARQLAHLSSVCAFGPHEWAASYFSAGCSAYYDAETRFAQQAAVWRSTLGPSRSVVVPRWLAERVIERFSRSEVHVEPTARQLEILRLLASGETQDRVGELLHLSRGTVKRDLNDLRETSGCRSTMQLVALAVSWGWIDPDRDPSSGRMDQTVNDHVPMG